MKPTEERNIHNRNTLPATDSQRASLLETLRLTLGLERNVVVMSIAVFLLGAGEELWKSFLPKFLESLGASVTTVGLFGTTRDFLDAVYQYPGGYVADRIGSRRALILFSALATIGYAIYAISANWQMVFLGLVFSLAWVSMGSPAIFALIAERLPANRRAMGFTVQSILKRVPVIVSPIIGGALIASFGLLRGMRTALVVTIGLGLLALIAQWRFYFAPEARPADSPLKLIAQFNAMHQTLKRLLMSDILIRTCEGMVNVFVVLYVINVVGATATEFGLLIAVQMTTSIVVYFPAARLADRFGRKPFVIATFICFSLFPLAVVLSQSFVALVFAFMIGGLRELGEPARKAMIVDLADPTRRGRTVGLYYLIRSLSITPASVIGGLLWRSSPALPFLIACLIGLLGTTVFAFTVDRQHAA